MRTNKIDTTDLRGIRGKINLEPDSISPLNPVSFYKNTAKYTYCNVEVFEIRES